MQMRKLNLFEDDPYEGASIVPGNYTLPKLKTELLERLLIERTDDFTDLEVALSVTQAIKNELISYATHGGISTDNDEIKLLIRAGKVVVARIGLEFPKLPFRNYDSFKDYWMSEGMSGGGSWSVRRGFVSSLFQPLEAAIDEIEEREMIDGLANPISPRSDMGWPVVDSEIAQLRKRFAVAHTPQDYSGIGVACVRVLESLGDVVYDPAIHSLGRSVLPRDKTKSRFESVVSHNLHGSASDEIVSAAKAIVALAHKVKHTETSSRRDAGIACDAVILLANMLRRVTVAEEV